MNGNGGVTAAGAGDSGALPMITASLRTSNGLGPASSGLSPAVGSAGSVDHDGPSCIQFEQELRRLVDKDSN